ncbi:MAG: EAL domain-containing protein [Rhodobacteraceae bacterium]|nr:EAL domain-containing protein [Paracoccaceae bacterium]
MVSIRVRTALIVAFLVASGAPLVIFWLWPHSAALEREVEEANERHLLLALNAADDIAEYHKTLTEAFRTMVPLLADGSDTGFAAPLLRRLHFRHLCLVDPVTGEVLRAVPVETDKLPKVVPPAMLADLRALAALPEGSTSPVRIGGDGEPEMFMAHMENGKIALASIGTRYFRELASRIAFGKKGHAAIVDQTGRVIAHPRADWIAEPHDLSGLEPVQKVMHGQSSVTVFYSPAIDADVIAGIAPVPGTGWGVMVPQPIAELQAKAERIAQSARFVFLAGMGLSALLAMFFASHLARGIRSVSEAARRMALGEDSVRLSPWRGLVSLAEIDKLRTSFNAMAQQVEDSRRSLLTMAKGDSLTGLLNRSAFVDAATEMLHADATGSRHVMFFIDVDHFKSINDVYGHAAGDAILQGVARRLRAAAGPGDLIARQSGDEFLLLHALRPRENPEIFGQDLIDRLCDDYTPDGRRITVTCSVGGCLTAPGASALDFLIGCSDQAMYNAKQKGRGVLSFFDSELKEDCQRKERLLVELKAAVLGSRVQAAYQPILDARSGAVIGFEALARWPRPAGQEISAEHFIALAEESGLIGELGAAVRREALGFAADLRREGLSMPVSLNVSRIELCAPGFQSELDLALRSAGLTPDAVILEITESIFTDGSGRVRNCLDALRANGHRLSLDDFGKGYSAHGLLSDFTFEQLKIDTTFVGEVPGDARATAVVSSLIDLGKRLDLGITLEGIASAEAADFAYARGVDAVQGYFYSHPLSHEDAISYALESARVAFRATAV